MEATEEFISFQTQRLVVWEFLGQIDNVFNFTFVQDVVDSTDVSVRLSELPTSSKALIRVFEILSPAVFDGCKNY